LKRLEHEGSFFKEYRIVLLESGSTDDTKEHLEAAMKRNPRIAVQFDPPLPAIQGSSLKPDVFRYRRMAQLRNRLLGLIDMADDEFLIMVDMDHLNVQGLASCFERDDWDAVCAAGWTKDRKLPYDAVAYRLLDPKDDNKLNESPSLRQQDMLFTHTRPEWTQVSSAFGGMAVYRNGPALKNAMYSDNTTSCEHCGFHWFFDRVFLNPHLRIQRNE